MGIGQKNDIENADMSNSSAFLKNSNSNQQDSQKHPTLKQVRGVILSARIKTKGSIFNSDISKECGWSRSRLSQIITNWNNPKYVPDHKKQEFFETIKDSAHRLTFNFKQAQAIKSGDLENGKRYV